MKFAHAFWSKPLIMKKFFGVKEALEIILYEYGLSVELIHRSRNTITLYTDEIGASILSILPYDKIVVLDNTITQNHHFAASFKFEALRRMPLDATLIDGDIFLHRPDVFRIIKDSKSDILCSFFENKAYIDVHADRNRQMFELLKNKDLTFPPESYDDIGGWYNTSIIHFNDQDFKDKYIAQYTENIRRLSDDDFGGVWPDLVIEQRNLARLAASENKTIDTIIHNFPDPEADKYAIQIGFLHVGSAKRSHQKVVVKDLTTLNRKLARTIEQRIPYLASRLEKSED